MFDMLTVADITALLQVILVDLVLAGDNAIVIALVVAGFAPKERARLLMLAGGLLLLWVCWKLWRDLEAQRIANKAGEATGEDVDPTTAALEAAEHAQPKSLREAITQIVIADVSMSLDNVIAVAGIARHNTWVLVFGLVLSIAFMAFAATFIARLLSKHHWIAYIGLAIILYVAVMLIHDGFYQVPALAGLLPG